MARKADLFSLIAERQRAVAERQRASAEQNTKPATGNPEARPTPTAKRVAGSLGRVGANLRAWIGKTFPPARRSVTANTPARPGHALQLTGPWIAGIALVALGIGFIAGRAFGRPAEGAPGPNTELRTPVVPPGDGKKEVSREPKWLVDPAKYSATPSSENQTEVLANWCYPVVTYVASQRVAAERLAAHLWKHGIASARIRSFTHESKDYWATVVYVPSEKDGPRYAEQLAKVTPPEFEPNFAKKVGLLMELVRKGEGLVSLADR